MEPEISYPWKIWCLFGIYRQLRKKNPQQTNETAYETWTSQKLSDTSKALLETNNFLNRYILLEVSLVLNDMLELVCCLRRLKIYVSYLFKLPFGTLFGHTTSS